MLSAEMVLYRHHSGPLPPPEQLAKYDAVIPGLAERIVRRDEMVMEMAQSQGEHRQRLETAVINSNTRNAAVGQWLAFTIAIVFGFFAFFLSLEGHETTASVLGGGTLVSVVTVFVVGRKKQTGDLENKRQEQNRAITNRKQ